MMRVRKLSGNHVKRKLNNQILQILRFGRNSIPWMLIAIVVSIFNIALTILSSLYLGKLSDRAIATEFTGFIEALIPMLIVFVLQVPAAFLRTFASARFSENCMYRLRNKAAEHIQRLPISYIDNNASTDMLSKLNNDANIIQQFLQNSLFELIVQPLTFFASSVFLFVMSVNLSFVSFTAIPLFMALTLFISKPLEKYTEELQETMSEVTNVAQNVVSGITVVKSFQLEQIMEDKFFCAVDKSIRRGLQLSKIIAMISPIRNMMQFIPFILVFAYGGFLVISNELTFGQLITFINLSNAVVNPLEIFPQAIAAYRLAKGAGTRILETLEIPLEKSGTNAISKSESCVAVEFTNVTFGYEGKEVLFNGLDFNIPVGEVVALVGHSGCGKSTLVKLIAGFYMPLKGEIKIFGSSTNKWDLEKLRESIAIVSQDAFVFPCSIFENIAFGKNNASPEQIYNAAKLAGIHDFIVTLPEGYNTLAGERGAKLSGGQKQRISIARAILKNAPILLLDEATSSLDAESEHNIQKSLEILMQNRTTLIIAHRFSTIKAASIVCVMDNGMIVACGKHNELLESSETYRRLYINQIGLDSTKSIEIETKYEHVDEMAGLKV